MNNDERAAVGTCYKHKGQTRRWRWGINWWRVKFVTAYRRLAGSVPAKSARYSLLARGGQRSHIVQSWLHEAGIDIRWWKAVIRHCARRRFRRL